MGLRSDDIGSSPDSDPDSELNKWTHMMLVRVSDCLACGLELLPLKARGETGVSHMSLSL